MKYTCKLYVSITLSKDTHWFNSLQKYIKPKFSKQIAQTFLINMSTSNPHAKSIPVKTSICIRMFFVFDYPSKNLKWLKCKIKNKCKINQNM